MRGSSRTLLDYFCIPSLLLVLYYYLCCFYIAAVAHIDSCTAPGWVVVQDVARRCTEFVDSVRRKETGRVDAIFLVSHGDTLSILSTVVGKRGRLEDHRELGGLGNCEWLVLS
jgi:broad specificity phosphatase PhoE